VQQTEERESDRVPGSIAVIGASTDRSKYGNKAVRAYLRQGYTVYPVNPGADEVEGLKAYPSVRDLPETPDQATFYVPPEVGLKVIEDVAAAGIRRVWFNPGSESPELLRRAAELGLETVVACSILGVGEDPSDL
jgi:predicted CoA-binding protein